MNMAKLFFRSPEVESVDVVETYEVRWESRYGYYLHDVQPEVRVFASKKDARAFRAALFDAFRLLKHTAGNEVTLTKSET